MFEIMPLYLKPEYFDDVFTAIYREWGANNPKYWTEWIHSSMRKEGIPSTYVVLYNSIYIATFSFWTSDLPSRQDLTPWVGGLVVEKEYRGRGIGLYLQKQIKKILKSMKIRCAYLFTEMIGFYEKTGWIYIGDSVDEKDCPVRLYMLEITDYDK